MFAWLPGRKWIWGTLGSAVAPLNACCMRLPSGAGLSWALPAVLWASGGCGRCGVSWKGPRWLQARCLSSGRGVASGRWPLSHWRKMGFSRSGKAVSVLPMLEVWAATPAVPYTAAFLRTSCELQICGWQCQAPHKSPTLSSPVPTATVAQGQPRGPMGLWGPFSYYEVLKGPLR